MISDISNNLKAAMQDLVSYPNDSNPTVELEKIYLRIGTRYPFLEIEGPYTTIEIDSYNVANSTLEYVLRYYVTYNDEDQNDDEITKVTENVSGDIIKQVKLDTTRGGYAIVTKIAGYGAAFEEVENQLEFYIYVVLNIDARMDAKDPSYLG